MPQTAENRRIQGADLGGTFGKGRRCAIYDRRSTAAQGAPEDGLPELERIARQRGFDVVSRIGEIGSGKRSDRPGWQKIMLLARRGKIDAILVTRIDRAGRSSLDLLHQLEQLRLANVEFHAVMQGVSIRPGDSDPTSTLVMSILGAVSQWERDLIVSRVREGQQRARKAGKHLGRPRAAGPTSEQVRRLRTMGLSWRQISAKLGCSIAMARRRSAAG